MPAARLIRQEYRLGRVMDGVVQRKKMKKQKNKFGSVSYADWEEKSLRTGKSKISPSWHRDLHQEDEEEGTAGRVQRERR